MNSKNGKRLKHLKERIQIMMKLIWTLRVVAFLMVVGTVGSIEINKIDSYTAFLQIALGFSLLILSNFWGKEIKKAR